MAKEKMDDPRTAEPKPPFPPQIQEHPGIEGKMTPRPDYGADSYRGHGRLEGRVALITGGDSGIGRAVALAFAREGADVAIQYLPVEQPDADETRAAVEGAGRQAHLVTGDLGDPATPRRLIEETVARFGRIDILINNAAFQGKAAERFEDFDPERVRHTFQVNIIAMFELCRLALPHMKPGSAIVNVASIQAYKPSPPILDYASTKGAIVTFTKGLAQELGERGIRVNCIAPGPIWTPLIPASFGNEKTTKHGEGTPIGRAGQPAELAPAFVFLACDESRYITGEVLGITGGQPLP